MGLMQSSLILGFARLTNYAVMFVTPLILVRMLDVETYGEYREFLLYSTILASLFALDIRSNLNFIVSKRPLDAPLATSQTLCMLLLTTSVGLGIFVLGKHWFLMKASFDFVVPLVVYVFFVINFDVLENYWLGKQQPRNVLLFSTTRVLARVSVVIGATLVTRDLLTIIWSIVALEVLKGFICLLILWRLKLLVVGLDRELLKEQLRYIVPLSMAGLLFFANEKIGHLYISATLGASALAVYTVGTYQLPIIAIVRSAVADTLFPVMVKHSAMNSHEGMDLWKIANLYYCFLVFPAFAILFFYAEEFITLLFTDAYIAAVDVFRVALLVMLRQSFEMGTPLRAANANRYMLLGNLMAMSCNLPLLYFLSKTIGIAGAAVAWMVGDLVLSGFLANRILARYKITIAQLALWSQTFKVIAAAALAAPILFVGRAISESLVMVILSSLIYALAYMLIAKQMHIREIDLLMGRVADAARPLVLRMRGRA